MDETLRKLERLGDSVAVAKWRRRLGEKIPPVPGERVKLVRAPDDRKLRFDPAFVGAVGTVVELRMIGQVIEAWMVDLDPFPGVYQAISHFPAYEGELEIL